MRFEKYLKASKEPAWANYYIAYGDLKDILKESLERQRAAALLRASNRRMRQQSSATEFWNLDASVQPPVVDDAFSKALDSEVEKVVIFFLKAQGEIASKLLNLRLKMRALGPVVEHEEVDDDAEAMDRQGSMDTNASSDGIILKSPIAITPTTPKTHRRRRTATPSDLVEDYRDICNQLYKLLRFIELNAEAVRKIMKKHDRQLLAEDMLTGPYLTTQASRKPDSHLRQLFWHNGIEAITSSLKETIEELPENCRTLDHDYAIHAQDKAAIEDMIVAFEKVQGARTQVKQKTNNFMNFLSQKLMIFDQEELEIGDIHDLLQIPHGLSVWLNIAQIFLSTVNAYITVPTTNKYAENLGIDAAYSGVIIGMSPLAQIFSAFVFSYWSNYAFKAPLLVSCLLQLLGNVLYGAALGFNSVPLLLLGRFLGGAGTAEAVNRRYIADVIPPKERTSASVAFVTACALGMSAGPALAAVLFPVNFQMGRFPVIDCTAPAWLMVVLWGVFLLLMLVCFKEPSHRHQNDGKDHMHGGGHHHHHKSSGKKQQAPSFHKSASITGAAKSMAQLEGDEEAGMVEDEHTALRPNKGEGGSNSSNAGRYGAAGLALREEVSSTSPGPTDPPLYSMTPSSTMTAESSDGDSPVRGSRKTISSFRRRLRHPLAKIHPILVLVWRNKPLMITLAVYFLIEIVDEIILSSTGLIASSYFNWSIGQVGTFMACLGLLVLPANYLVGGVSEHGYEDRSIIVTSQVITIGGLLLVISYWGEYTEAQFLIGTATIFTAVAVMEGVDTSLMSKVIPPILSRGTFNSGLLAVQIGMVAKALGDGMITVIGLWADDLINGLYIPLLIITVGLSLICMHYFAAMT